MGWQAYGCSEISKSLRTSLNVINMDRRKLKRLEKLEFEDKR